MSLPGGVSSDPAFSAECARFFAARLRGPAEARAAVLSALAAGEPYSLARVACAVGPPAGLSRSCALRLGLLAEVVRATLRVCAEACDGARLPTRLDRARRVLVGDTLLTFCYELAADLPEPGDEKVRAQLPTVIGSQGFLAELVSGGKVAGTAPTSSVRVQETPGSDARGSPPARAAAFLEEALRNLGAALNPEASRTILAIADGA